MNRSYEKKKFLKKNLRIENTFKIRHVFKTKKQHIDITK